MKHSFFWILIGLFNGIVINLSLYYLRGFSRPVLDISVSVIVTAFIVFIYHWGYRNGRLEERAKMEQEKQR